MTPDKSPSARILVVQDELLVTEALQACLQHLGYQMLGTACNGAQALALAVQQRPDLVLLDVHLQGPLGGVQTALQLRDSDTAPPVVFLASQLGHDEVPQLMQAAPYGLVVGPFEAGALRAAIDIAMARARHEQRTMDERLQAQARQLRQANEALEVQARHLANLNEALWQSVAESGVGPAVAPASVPVKDPKRLAALARTRLMDSVPEEVFDRFTRLAAASLQVPVCLVSLVDDRRQFFKSAVGLSEPWATLRETPLSHSFCQHVVNSGTPLVVEDALADPRVRDNGAVRDLGVRSYLGVPLTTPDGHVLGSFCAIDGQAHHWSDQDREMLERIAQSVLASIAVRMQLQALEQRVRERTAEVLASEAKYRSLFDSVDAGLCVIEVLFDEHDKPVDFRFLEVNQAFKRQTGIHNAVGRRMREIAPTHEQH